MSALASGCEDHEIPLYLAASADSYKSFVSRRKLYGLSKLPPTALLHSVREIQQPLAAALTDFPITSLLLKLFFNRGPYTLNDEARWL